MTCLAISPNHPLRRLFGELVAKELPWDREIAKYVADLLVDFAHVDRLYRIRDSRGRRLEEVGEILAESNPLTESGSFFREREVRKHIGDVTLFLTGLFPEYVFTQATRRAPGQPSRLREDRQRIVPYRRGVRPM